MTFTDHRGDNLSVGDRVIPIGWGEIPLWLSTTQATVVGFGTKKVQIKFDGVRYDADQGDKPHAAYPTNLRRIPTPAERR